MSFGSGRRHVRAVMLAPRRSIRVLDNYTAPSHADSFGSCRCPAGRRHLKNVKICRLLSVQVRIFLRYFAFFTHTHTHSATRAGQSQTRGNLFTLTAGLTFDAARAAAGRRHRAPPRVARAPSSHCLVCSSVGPAQPDTKPLYGLTAWQVNGRFFRQKQGGYQDGTV